MTVLLRGVARVITAQSEHLFLWEGKCSKSSPSWFRGNTWLRSLVCARQEKE